MWVCIPYLFSLFSIRVINLENQILSIATNVLGIELKRQNDSPTLQWERVSARALSITNP